MKKGNKLRDQFKPVPSEELLVSGKVDPKDYERYVREHNRKLRQLEREARGDNMEFPE